jgi:hypothetical protein
MQRTELPSPEAAILKRIVGPDAPSLSATAAEAFLSLGFSPPDEKRMNELAAFARKRRLTRAELSEVEAYSRIDSLLGIVNSKARLALKQRRPTNGTRKPH